MIHRMLRPTVSVLAGLVLATGLCAQTPAPKLEFPAASPAATIKQRVGLTDFEVNYSRPSVRGRKIFGGLLPYGEIWRTGANTATKITFNTPVKFNGTPVAPGTYEVFTIPGESEWTVVLHQNMSQWGTYEYDAKNDVARIKVQPKTLSESVETFTIGFNDLANEAVGTLCFAWAKTAVMVTLQTDVVGVLVPQIEAAMAAEGKKPYASSAMFYYENDLDLKVAAKWMDAAIALQPDAFYLVYRKALILEKMGDKAGALAAATQSLEMAKKAKGALRDEYVRLNEGLIARVR